MAKKLMTKTYCDFCGKEIEESTSKIYDETRFMDTQGVAQVIGAEIRLISTEPRKRFGHDICGECVYRAVDQMNPYKKKTEVAAG